MNWITKSLIRKHGGKVLPFRKLSIPAQAAMAFYMSVDGTAWDQPSTLDRDIVEVLPWYRRQYGSDRFGYVELPTKEVVSAIWDVHEDLREEYGSIQEWVEWYRSHGDVPDHPENSRWPVILSSIEDEFLQDGWHRFSDYLRKGAKVIPAIYYPFKP